MFHSIDRDGSLVDVSNHWLQVLGYQRDEVIGRKSTEFLTEASRRYSEEVVLPEFFKSGFCNDISYQMVTKAGAIRDVLVCATAERDEAGEVIRSLAVLTDVSERKRAELALRDAEAVFSSAFRSSATVLSVSTLPEGRIIEVNESFERTLGYRRDEVVGREIEQLQIWEHLEDRARYARLVQESGEVHDLEVRFRSKSGAVVVGLLSGQIVELAGERCLLSQVNDITERKHAAEEIEVLHTNLAARAYELEIANADLGAFSYTVSHDLRKPLTVISGYCQVILELCSDQLKEQCVDYLREILNGTDRMAQLIETLLEFSRISHSKANREAVDLSLMATQVVRELRQLEPRRRVAVEIAPGQTDQGDPKLLRVVLENLLGNAWKYSGEAPEARIEFGSLELEGGAAYFVRDNGVGFDAANASGLFTAFHRLPGAEQFKGFGIGLATVQRIIKSHGGRVWAESEPGKGATFYFTIKTVKGE